MFTGIIESTGFVRHFTADSDGARLIVETPWTACDTSIGDSIAVNGACLTIVEAAGGSFKFQVGPETLARTNLGELKPGGRVNLERAILASSRLGGHFVQGHVDGVAKIATRRRVADCEFVEFDAPPELTDPMVPKGSVAVDGISLTIVSVAADRFSVMLIPHTLAHTTLGIKQVGDSVNIESDILSKYVTRAVRNTLARP